VPNTKVIKKLKETDRVVVRFAGDSGDGMQLAGSRFTDATAIRPPSRTRRNCLKPSPRGPSRFAPGTLQSVKLSGRVSEAFQPIFRYGSPCS